MELSDVIKRATQLRMAKGVSARAMSLTLGKNTSFINNIENGKSGLSVSSLLEICEYLEVTPFEFFNIDDNNPSQTREVTRNYLRLPPGKQTVIANLMVEMAD
ncbi:MAG: helix-turn-helix domain-containing protein [Oscillospiraceae bacterium]|nr:helix-turn-helix domain-containing protein [Oscillospiraceae bacterium]